MDMIRMPSNIAAVVFMVGSRFGVVIQLDRQATTGCESASGKLISTTCPNSRLSGQVTLPDDR